MNRFSFSLGRNSRSKDRSMLDQLDHLMDELDFQLDRLRSDTRDEWHDLRRFVVRTRRELDHFLQRSDRPASKIADGARELGRELKKSLARLS